MTKDELKAKIEANIDAADHKIDVLKAKASEAAEEGNEELHEQLEALGRHKDKLSQKLSEIGDATEEEWEDFKAGAQSLWDDFSNKVDELFHRHA